MTQKQPSPLAIKLNIGLLKLSRNWLTIVLVVVGIFASLPWFAPVLARAGLFGPANVIYTLYSPMCHQFAFRSFFLFGEQPVYPRDVAGTGLNSFDELAPTSEAFVAYYRAFYPIYNQGGQVDTVTTQDLAEFTVTQQIAARHFVGNEDFGFKTAVCQRDLFIYMGLFVGGIIYSRFRYRIRPVPFLLYIFLGLGPIGIDGFSQLLSYPPFEWWAVRETEPIFRVITGGLFGLMNAWLGFPYIERSMADTRAQLESKFARRGIDV